MNKPHATGKKERGKLRIGNDWNAITIIALSQTNPLKAIAELAENSIDAGAGRITIIRGKEKSQPYFKIIDDGNGIPCAEDNKPDFKYVATHICDSLKRRLKEQGARNIQGEFGIGLLSFWTVGHKLSMVSSGKDGKAYQMIMEKGKPGYVILPRPHLFSSKGTQITISPLLEGIRQVSGEKIQRYLAAELRDRIRHSGVKIKIIDRTSRQEFDVQPRQYSGQLLHNLPALTTQYGDVYAELYLEEKNTDNSISLFRCGTRVLPSITSLDEFQNEPWTCGYFQGVIDAPFLHLTPGTRDGIIRDEKFASFVEALVPLGERLNKIFQEYKKAEDERMSKNILRSVQKAIREAILALPPEEYDWFDIYKGRGDGAQDNRPTVSGAVENTKAMFVEDEENAGKENSGQKQFFEFAGPLANARIQPASTLVEVGKTKSFRAIGLDRTRRVVEENLAFIWSITQGSGGLDKFDGEIVIFQAPQEPGISRLKLVVKQNDIVCEAETVVTIVDNLIKPAASDALGFAKGLPGYTLENAPGKLWRSRFDDKHNIVVINSGHRDFIYAGALNQRKLRYICRLFTKELVLRNFSGEQPGQILERLIELSMYTEENLK